MKDEKPILADEVANGIVDDIEKQVEEIRAKTDETSAQIEINVSLSNRQLSDRGKRGFSREKYVEAVSKRIEERGYEVTRTKNGIEISETDDASPEIYEISTLD